MAKTKYQSGAVSLVWRSEIHEHPLNPRQISESAKKKLRQSVKEIGVMDTPVLNRLTGHLVGGHQRLHTIDFLEKYVSSDGATKNDYQVEVSIVELSPEDEAKALVRLNNESLQGSWDTELLIEVANVVSFEDMGFDQLDVNLLFDGDSRFTEAFPDTQEVKETKATLDEVKAARAESTEKMKETQQAEFYFVVVCRDDQERKDLLTRLKVPNYERYVSADALSGALNSA